MQQAAEPRLKPRVVPTPQPGLGTAQPMPPPAPEHQGPLTRTRRRQQLWRTAAGPRPSRASSHARSRAPGSTASRGTASAGSHACGPGRQQRTQASGRQHRPVWLMTAPGSQQSPPRTEQEQHGDSALAKAGEPQPGFLGKWSEHGAWQGPALYASWEVFGILGWQQGTPHAREEHCPLLASLRSG